MTHNMYKIAALAAVVAMTPGIRAEVVTEANLGSGYQGNLFNDSNSTGDSYASAGLKIKYYPSASAELSAGASYNAFATYRDLSSLTADASATLIPTSETSPVTLALAGRISYRKFGPLYEIYDQAAALIGTDMNVRLTPWAHLLTSVSYLSSEYTNATYGSNHGLSASGGINLTLIGSNSVAIRGDYTQRFYDQLTPSTTGPGSPHNMEQTNSEKFEIAGLLLRFSRPIGQRTGLNLSFGHRSLLVDNEYAVSGYTVDYLSPWADLWEGSSASISIKHFFPGQVTGELSAAHYDKSYVDAIESDGTSPDSFILASRVDRLSTAAMSLARPILLQGDHLLTPAVGFGYRQNRSSIDAYDYEDFWISLSVKAAF